MPAPAEIGRLAGAKVIVRFASSKVSTSPAAPPRPNRPEFLYQAVMTADADRGDQAPIVVGIRHRGARSAPGEDVVPRTLRAAGGHATRRKTV